MNLNPIEPLGLFDDDIPVMGARTEMRTADPITYAPLNLPIEQTEIPSQNQVDKMIGTIASDDLMRKFMWNTKRRSKHAKARTMRQVSKRKKK